MGNYFGVDMKNINANWIAEHRIKDSDIYPGSTKGRRRVVKKKVRKITEPEQAGGTIQVGAGAAEELSVERARNSGIDQADVEEKRSPLYNFNYPIEMMIKNKSIKQI